MFPQSWFSQRRVDGTLNEHFRRAIRTQLSPFRSRTDLTASTARRPWLRVGERRRQSGPSIAASKPPPRVEAVPAALETWLIKIYRDYQGEEDPRRPRTPERDQVLKERNVALEERLGQYAHTDRDSPRFKDLRGEVTDLEREANDPRPADANDFDA